MGPCLCSSWLNTISLFKHKIGMQSHHAQTDWKLIKVLCPDLSAATTEGAGELGRHSKESHKVD